MLVIFKFDVKLYRVNFSRILFYVAITYFFNYVFAVF